MTTAPTTEPTINDCQLWHDGTDWYWAVDHAHLDELIKAHAGHTYEEMCGDAVADCFEVTGRPEADTDFTMNAHSRSEMPDPFPPNAKVRDLPTNGMIRVVATVAAWRAVSKPGFFASTEW